jgi:hypothetical protein
MAELGRYKDIPDESIVVSRREISGNGLQVITQETKLNPPVVLWYSNSAIIRDKLMNDLSEKMT